MAWREAERTHALTHACTRTTRTTQTARTRIGDAQQRFRARLRGRTRVAQQGQQRANGEHHGEPHDVRHPPEQHQQPAQSEHATRRASITDAGSGSDASPFARDSVGRREVRQADVQLAHHVHEPDTPVDTRTTHAIRFRAYPTPNSEALTLQRTTPSRGRRRP